MNADRMVTLIANNFCKHELGLALESYMDSYRTAMIKKMSKEVSRNFRASQKEKMLMVTKSFVDSLIKEGVTPEVLTEGSDASYPKMDIVDEVTKQIQASCSDKLSPSVKDLLVKAVFETLKHYISLSDK